MIQKEFVCVCLCSYRRGRRGMIAASAISGVQRAAQRSYHGLTFWSVWSVVSQTGTQRESDKLYGGRAAQSVDG